VRLPRLLPVFALLVAPHCLAEWDYQTIAGTGGVPLNVVTAGDPGSPPILFIHGIGQSHYSFVKQLDSDLAEDFFLVTFDLRGHGASGKPWEQEAYADAAVWAGDVAAVMAATGIEQPVAVAWSYGTLVILDYVREQGIGGLAGINLTGAIGALRPFRMPATDDPNAAEFARIRELQVSPALTDNIRAIDRMVQWLTATPMPEEEHRIFEAISLMFPAYARRAMVQRRLDNQDLLAKLELPVLLSLGEADNPTQIEDGADMAATHGSLSVYADAGHSVFYEQPERFNRELRRFAERAQLRDSRRP
jgi:non-heme chloroperoxidase